MREEYVAASGCFACCSPIPASNWPQQDWRFPNDRKEGAFVVRPSTDSRPARATSHTQVTRQPARAIVVIQSHPLTKPGKPTIGSRQSEGAIHERFPASCLAFPDVV
jgi:hypothetical protein